MAGWWGLRSTYECRAGNFNFRPAVAEEGIEAEQINEAVEVDFGLESHPEDFIILFSAYFHFIQLAIYLFHHPGFYSLRELLIIHDFDKYLFILIHSIY